MRRVLIVSIAFLIAVLSGVGLAASREEQGGGGGGGNRLQDVTAPY